LESLSSGLPGLTLVPDVGQGPRCEAAARPGGVSGLRYLPAVQRPFPHTDIRTTRGYQHVGAPLMADAVNRAGERLWKDLGT
jgi:hypothetical protein